MEKYKPYKRILCLDFDGVIHSYTSGWTEIDDIPDPPVEGAFDAIESYLQLFRVVIYSSRSFTPEGIKAMKQWFLKYGWEKDIEGNPADLEFAAEKPPAFVTLDDRAITFTGKFPPISELWGFESWTQK